MGDRNEGELLELRLDIQGIQCAACVWLLDALFRRQRGAVSLTINPALGRAEVVWDPALGDIREFLDRAAAFGYRFGPRRKTAVPRSRGLSLRMALTLGLASQVMMFSVPYYLGLLPAEGALHAVLGVTNFVLAALIVVLGGGVFFRSAWLGLRHRVVHLDLPIALGIALAFAASVVAYFRVGPQATYFDTVSLFVALMLVGRWLQQSVLDRNRNALLADGGVGDLHCRRFLGTSVEFVPVAAVEAGDELWVVPGEIVPVEATVLGSPGRFALDWISGESDPLTFSPGERAPAGARNTGSATARLRAEQPFAASRLGGLLQTPAPRHLESDRWWGRVGAIYAGAVLVLGSAAFFLWIGSGLERALEVTASVLVVTCPCALGLAVPLAHELTVTRLRGEGIFLRDAGFLDRGLRIRKVVFDKTGTLTQARLHPNPESLRILDALSPPLRSILANLAARSNHPVSRAVAGALEGDGVEIVIEDGEPVVETEGDGLSWNRGGRVYRLGRPGFAAPGAVPFWGTGPGPGAVYSVDGDTLAELSFEESLKEDAVAEIRRLRGRGLATCIVSGDRADRVAATALRLGIPAADCAAGMSPEGKAAWIRDRDHRDTLMVGDGINDAPAFAAAFAAATPAVDHPALPARADFYFLGDGIRAVRVSLEAARRLRAVIRGTLVTASAYNIAALILCYLGLIGPLAAAVLMPVSSVAVVSITAYRLGRRNRP